MTTRFTITHHKKGPVSPAPPKYRKGDVLKIVTERSGAKLFVEITGYGGPYSPLVFWTGFPRDGNSGASTQVGHPETLRQMGEGLIKLADGLTFDEEHQG